MNKHRFALALLLAASLLTACSTSEGGDALAGSSSSGISGGVSGSAASAPAQPTSEQPGDAPPSSIPLEESKVENIPFTANVIRFHKTGEDPLPEVQVLTSIEQLKEYQALYGAQLSLEDPYGSADLAYQLTQYDEAFFKKNMLILYCVEESSGSVEVKAGGLVLDGNHLKLRLTRKSPGDYGTMDMAWWACCVEASNQYKDYPVGLVEVVDE